MVGKFNFNISTSNAKGTVTKTLLISQVLFFMRKYFMNLFKSTMRMRGIRTGNLPVANRIKSVLVFY